MTELDINLIKRYWNTHYTIDEIVQMLPYPKTVARTMIKALRRDGTLPRRSLKEKRIEQLIAAYNSGVTNMYDLAEMFDISPKTAGVYLYEGGIKRDRHIEHRGYPHKDKYYEIVSALRESDESISALARRFGVSRQYVHQIKERLKENEND